MYECEECGGSFSKNQLDSESLSEGDIYCKSCAKFLMESGQDAVDPGGNFDSFEDWDENGH